MLRTFFRVHHIPSQTHKKMGSLGSEILNSFKHFLVGAFPDSNNFDVTLIITLLRHLISLNPPDNGFDKLPLVTNSTPSAALATIKYYRNYMAHVQEAIIKSSDFTKAWNDITGVSQSKKEKYVF